MRVLVGGTGLIGKYLQSQQQFDVVINSTNICDIPPHSEDIIVAAPTGNRLAVKNDPNWDLENVMSIMKFLSGCASSRVTLISTVDTIHAPHTHYGHNRLLLENFVKSLRQYHIIRLCSIIHQGITKNVLHDLTHQKWMESIRPAQKLQWYPLVDLSKHIGYVHENKIKDINLVSEPITVGEIKDKFFPDLITGAADADLGYDVHCHCQALCEQSYPYVYDKQEIFQHIKEYVHNQHSQQ